MNTQSLFEHADEHHPDTGLKHRSDAQRRDLISADRVSGTAVYNRQDEKLGTVDSIFIDKFSGNVPYVIMSFGGFLGIGEKYHPVPWNQLDYDTEVGGYRIDLDRSQLEAAPSYDRESVDGFDADRDAAVIDSYYASTGTGFAITPPAIDRRVADRRASDRRADDRLDSDLLDSNPVSGVPGSTSGDWATRDRD